jgi:ABC-type Zn uptake system ZnuABC Zn-binding protein ZnuA
VVVLGDRVPVRLPGTEAARVDPHWWHDPRNAEAAVKAIRAALVRAVPARRAAFDRRAAAYLAKLRGLDRGIATCFSQVPRARRKLVTDHDAFAYFARRYGIDVVGTVIPSLTTRAQPSAGEIARLVELIRRERVEAVFPESSLNARLAESVARETGASAGYRLYGDTLGPAGSLGATYLSMEQANADAMVRGFTGGAKRCVFPGQG